MGILLAVAWSAFLWSAARRWKLMAQAGRPEPRWDRLWERFTGTVRFALAQWRMPLYPLTGIAHILIFWGFLVLLLRSLILWGRGFDPAFDFWVLGLDSLPGKLYSVAKDGFAVAVFAAAFVALVNRVFFRPKRLTQSFEAVLILLIITTMMVADVLYDAADVSLRHLAAGSPVLFHKSEPAGSLLAMGLAKLHLSERTLHLLAQTGFWTHSCLVLLFLNLLPYGKHFHVLTAIPNVFFRDLRPRGRLVPIADIENQESFGAAKITDFSWKAMLDMYSCTECGRCTDHCPANRTGKKLSPKHLTLDLRDNLYARSAELIGPIESGHPAGDATDGAPSGEKPEHASETLVPNVIDPDVLWACTTCRACEQECPVFISYVDKILEMRRNLVLERGEVPAALATALRGIETNSNPWNISAMDRAKWAEGLDVPTMAETDGKGIDYLLWVGCAASFDDRAKKIARATVALLRQAGVSFAILGEEEQCTGDIARRAGNEYLFQTLAQANVETLNKYRVRRIITVCPHCFNTLANEYPDFGGYYRVISHGEFLAQLVKDGKLTIEHKVRERTVYHDSCYLGRYNDVYEGPRDVLRRAGVELVEAPEHHDRGLCCGAGGAQYFMEEQTSDRMNVARTTQILASEPKLIATACPFCMTMLTDGLKAKSLEESIRQLDIAEVLLEACGEGASSSKAEA
ncbi:MAG: (Fe-S)-binding protein [Acidobacteria bacterium]|nr:(Fe-S)-binding protein [Acidobacteriota bacterium]